MIKLILVYLNGGLGNQLFQYAHAKSLASDRTKIILKTSNYLRIFQIFKRNTPRHPSLLKLINIEKNNIFNKNFYLYEFFFSFWKKIKEKQPFIFQKIIIDNKNIKLIGYWQSYKYFKDIKHDLYKEIYLDNIYKIKNDSKFQLINKCNSVSIHVRRGDYVNNKITNKFHGLMGPDYFKKAIKIMRQQISRPIFFVFSDDINWCKNEFGNHFHYIYPDEKNDSTVKDFLLMISCRNFIISNSSFSWWAAYLSSNKKKTVISPKYWINNFNETSDLIPSNWIKL